MSGTICQCRIMLHSILEIFKKDIRTAKLFPNFFSKGQKKAQSGKCFVPRIISFTETDQVFRTRLSSACVGRG